MGRGIVESGLFRSERYELEERTTDPSTSEGEMWIRTDIAPDTDQIATLRFDAGGSTWDLPIYDVAATTDNVEKAWRMQVGGVTGFVPITDDSPAHPALKMQHNGAAYGAHDSLTASAIPDSVDHQYKAPDFSTPWPDAIGNADMSISGLTSSTFSNGEDSVAGDGASHGEADITDLGSQTQFGIAFTAEYSSISSQVYFLGQNDGGVNLTVETASGEVGLRINDGSNNIDAESTNQYDDGSVHAIVINKTGNSASDIEIYVDDMGTNEATVATSGTIDPATYSNSLPFYIFARNDGGAESGAINADMGTIETNSSPYSQSEREDFVSRRPEV